ncbi:MAG TPA: hypothetical protein VFD82_02650 [Planctomycetota bacterium]|nr:hypothetical protein [Planctomycetota bacterium]
MHRILAVWSFVGTLAAQSAETVLLPDLLDLRFPAARALARLTELTREANVQISLGNPGTAATIQGIVANLHAVRTGLAPVPVTAGIEIDVVGFYQGAGATSTTPGTAAVQVDRPGSTVVLVLNAFDPITWTVTRTPGTTVIAVIAYSYSPQVLLTTGVPGALVVQLSWPVNGDGDYFGLAGSDVSARLNANTWCFERLALFATTFGGAYSAPAAPFVVGAANADWRDQWVTAEAVAAGNVWNAATRALAHALFSGQLFLPLLTQPVTSPGPATVALASALGVFTPIIALPNVTDYALGNGVVYTLAGALPSTLGPTLQSIPIPPSPTLPPIIWANTITYDALRNRLLVSSFGGSGALWGWNATTTTWSVLNGNLQNQEPVAIVHHPQHDATFGLVCDTFAPAPYRLRRYDSSGAVTATMTLPLPVLFEGLLDDHHLYTWGAMIVYVGPPHQILGFRLRHCYVINPLTADVLSASYLVH